MKKIYFVTTNQYKFEKFTQAISIPGIEIEQLSEETPEIQAPNNRQIAEFSAWFTAQKINLPVITEDVGLYIQTLRGFPGPYLNQIEKWIETDGFLQLLLNKKDRSAYWEYAISYCEPRQTPKTFYTHQKGSIAKEAKGNSGWYMDKIFIPEGQVKTISELLDNREYVRNDDHYLQLKEYLLKLGK
ncbi:MAG: non-canonical purine NTP pyrophosphatase [Candidatus Dojkabacteria bacterium]|nr:MAG: non-canonical purine NTP pyrophosphatase [Candidatus Dojkabacteria bacterium]GIW61220.1 MAG: non-canonical purine NTP pyrophosphatase [Patescibacteria group bacterium]